MDNSDEPSQVEDLLGDLEEIGPLARILVVDDHHHIRNILKHVLEKHGYAVTGAGNAAEATMTLGMESFDLAILDVMLPDRDGFSICSHIKKTPELQHIQVLMLTGLNQRKYVLKGIRAGADDYILKPFEKEMLVGKVKLLLEKVAQAESPEVEEERRERRRIGRDVVQLSLTWSPVEEREVLFKARVLNVSPLGVCFEAPRNHGSEAYSSGGVDPAHPLAKYSRENPDAIDLEIAVSLPDGDLIKLSGKIVHIHRPPEEPETEQVGVEFTGGLDVDAERLEKFLGTA